MTYQEIYNTVDNVADDIEARLMAIAFNAVKETALAQGRDSQLTDNDTKTALTIRKILNNIAGLAEDTYQPMPLAVKNEGKVRPEIDKVYNMLDKDMAEIVERNLPSADAPVEKKASKQQIV